jgi:uncharacterized RDD family membrane protein YckC
MLIAGGDGRAVWVLKPAQDEDKNPGFELYQRAANTGVWSARGNAQPAVFSKLGTPRAIAISRVPGGHSGSDAVVFGDGGKVFKLFLTSPERPLENLPRTELIRAVAGGDDQIFAMTFGRERRLNVGDVISDEDEAARPATASSPATAALPSPETAAATGAAATHAATGTGAAVKAPPSPEIFNVYWFPPVSGTGKTASASAPERRRPEPNKWSWLPPLGKPSGDAARLPSPSSALALVESRDRLLAIWSDPIRPRSLFVRALDYASAEPAWGEPVETTLPETEPIPAGSRLFAVTLDKTLYLLWTVPTGGTLSLHGGWLNTDPAAPADRRFKLTPSLLAMSLDNAAHGTTAANMAVAPSENSFVVVASEEGGGLKSMVFDNRGVRIAEPALVTLSAPRRDVQIGQNIALMLIVLMLTLSLWQWRQKPPAISLPKGYEFAPLHVRAIGLGIDLVIPYIAVLVIMGSGDGFLGMVGNWLSLPSHPEDFPRQWDLFLFLGIYLLLSTAGELFFRKSAGKALVGIEVRMLDGKPPTVGAILVRNLVRVPECVVGVALVYLMMSDRKQRLGDLLGKTVVVGQEAPETPDDPDK